MRRMICRDERRGKCRPLVSKAGAMTTKLWLFLVALVVLNVRNLLGVDLYSHLVVPNDGENFTLPNDTSFREMTAPMSKSSPIQQHLNATKKKDVAIFYNIFISPMSVKNSLSIVQEQLDFRDEHPHLASVPLYYTKFGAHEVPLPRSCDPCEELVAMRHGNEQRTLQYLYQYCRQYPVTGRVIYIHDKGSFTNTVRNKKLRIALTQGAFSAECATMPSGECDVCSSQFSVFPIPHTPGNMFVAECDYVVKLLPPRQYTAAKKAIVSKLWNSTWSSLGLPFYPNMNEKSEQINQKGWIGVERFAMEQWMYSHPSVRPCDVFREKYNYVRPPSHPKLLVAHRQMAPQGNESLAEIDNFHPWFHLPARLYEYRTMYSEVPPNNSWVYRAYPPL